MTDYKFRTTAQGIFESLSGFKYNFHEAIADLFDNSIDADANVVNISATPEQITIADNGSGMDKDSVELAISPWATAGSKRPKGTKGKYGIGLKSAGFSLGEIIEIHTKSDKDSFHHIILDHRKLSRTNDNGVKGDSVLTDIWKGQKLKTGTVIEIKRVNKRKVTQDQIDALRSRLGLVYYGMLEAGELKVLVNNGEVQSLDPLLSALEKNSKTNFYKRFPKKNITYTDKEGTSVRFTLSAAYIGRGMHWTEEEQKRYRFFLRKEADSYLEDDKDTRKKLFTRLDDQGLYISRNGRLITQGGWFKTRAFSHHHAPCRILIEYGSEGDSAMGVDHTKTKPELEKDLIDTFNTKYIDDIFSECERLYRDEGDEYKSERQKRKADEELKKRPLPKPDPADKLMSDDEKRGKFIPEYDEKQKELDRDLTKRTKQEDKWFHVVDRLPYDLLWDFKLNKDNEVTLLINEKHPGYQALFYEDKEDNLRRNLNVFFHVLANYEAHFAELSQKLSPSLKEELKKQFHAFRRYVSKNFREF